MVYSNKFDTPAITLAGVVPTFSGGASIATDPVYAPTYGNIRRNDGNTFATGITLTLSDLPVHGGREDQLRDGLPEFLGQPRWQPAPDNLDVWVDGA